MLRFRSINVLFAVLLIQGCLTEELVSFESALPTGAISCDPRLSGVWRNIRDVDDRTHNTQATKVSAVSYASIDVDKNCERSSLILSSVKRIDAEEFGGLAFRLSMFSLPTGNYVAMLSVHGSLSGDRETPMFQVAKYEWADNGQLRISLPNIEFLNQSASRGQIDARSKSMFGGGGRDLLMTVFGNSDEIAGFIDVHDEKLFSEWLDFSRIAAAPDHSAKTVDSIESLELASKLARDPSTTSDKLLKLASHNEVGVRKLVCRNRNVTPEILQILASDLDANVLVCVAGNAATPQSTIRILSRSEYAGVRGTAARSPNVPTEILATLAREPFRNIRAAVAGNLNTDLPTLEYLASDAELYVRTSVAGNANSNDALKIYLAKDSDATVRYRVVQNHPPRQVLLDLYNDEDRKVRTQVRNQLKAADVALIESIKGGSAPSQDILRKLATSPELTGRFFLAGQSQTPYQLLEELSRDEHTQIRLVIAKRPDTPGNILAILAKDGDPNIRRSVARHTNTPARTIYELAYDSNSEVKNSLVFNRTNDTKLLSILAADQDPQLRGRIAKIADDVPLLVRLARDQDAEVRRGLLMNTPIPREVASILAIDSDRQIREFAESWVRYYDNHTDADAAKDQVQIMIEPPDTK